MQKAKSIITSRGGAALIALVIAITTIISPLLSGKAMALGEKIYYKTGKAGTVTTSRDMENYSRFYNDGKTVKTLEAVYNASSSTAKATIDSIKNQGYLFAGWETSTYSKEYQPGESIADYYPSSNVTLVAQWAKPATIKLNTSEVTTSAPINIMDDEDVAGTVSFDKFPALQGKSLTITVAPSEDYRVTSFKVDGESKSLNDEGKYTISSATATEEIEVSLIRTYEITTSVTGLGEVNPTDAIIDEGSSFDLAITPNTGWHLSSLKVNGNIVNFQGETYHVESVEEDMEFTVDFARDVHNITVEADEGAIVTPLGNVPALYGENVTFSIEIENGYTLNHIELDGDDITSQLDFEGHILVEDVTDDMILSVFTDKDEYEVIEGEDQDIDVNEVDGLTVRFSGDCDLFNKLNIDGKDINISDYEVVCGSTIVTLKKSLLLTLGNGEHDIKAFYANGNFAETHFILEGVPEVPNTGLFSVLTNEKSSEFISLTALISTLGVLFFFGMKKLSKSPEEK